MRFRPCIDIHNGIVKQIVGSSLKDEGSSASENYVSAYDSVHYADMFRERGLSGGHAIILNRKGTPEYEASYEECIKALKAYPGGLQVGGGINPENAGEFLDAGASHVIVTSYVFADGIINKDNLDKISKAATPDKLVLDLSCKKIDGSYFVMTDRWQKKTDEILTLKLLEELSAFCDEFLIHAVDSEGKANGPEKGVLEILKDFDLRPVTYAGGIASYEDIISIRDLCEGKVDITVGSALDIYGGKLEMDEIVKICS